jgi:hypothetical protein
MIPRLAAITTQSLARLVTRITDLGIATDVAVVVAQASSPERSQGCQSAGSCSCSDG